MEIQITIKNAHQITNINEICKINCLDTDTIIHLKYLLIQQKLFDYLDISDISILYQGQVANNEIQIKDLNIESDEFLLYKVRSINKKKQLINEIQMKLMNMGFNVDLEHDIPRLAIQKDLNIKKIIIEIFSDSKLNLDDKIKIICKQYPDLIQILRFFNFYSVYEVNPELFYQNFIQIIQQYLERLPEINKIFNQQPKAIIDSFYKVIKNSDTKPIQQKGQQQISYTQEERDMINSFMKTYEMCEQEVIWIYKQSNRDKIVTETNLRQKFNQLLQTKNDNYEQNK